jgi:hypothetical protein
MRTRSLTAALVLAGYALLAPTPWSGAAHAQVTTLFSATGTVSAPNPQNPRTGNYFANLHAVTLTGGQSYTIRILPTAESAYRDSYLILLGPTGGEVGRDDDNGRDIQVLSSKLVLTAPATGTYTIVASTFGTARVMTYQTTVEGPAGTGGAPEGIPNVRLNPAPAGPEAAGTAVAGNAAAGPEPVVVVAAAFAARRS